MTSTTLDTASLQTLVEHWWEERTQLAPADVPADLGQALEEVFDLLDAGRVRVAQKVDGQWQVNQWLKKAVLLYFRTHDNAPIDAGYTQFYDKVPLKFANQSPEQLRAGGVRVVPPAVARRGAYIAPGTVLMPSYVNLGAYVDSGTMVDTWATVGSCAQIGKNVHLSGGVGIGGVLEPLQAGPTIIEDNCFIGASTKIYDRATGTVSYGRVPAGAVVVPGTLPSACGKYSLSAAIIVKRVDAQTRAKTSINELLRD